jgi:hypothetical protein
MCPKIDVMERECKKLEVGRDLNKASVFIRIEWKTLTVMYCNRETPCMTVSSGTQMTSSAARPRQARSCSPAGCCAAVQPVRGEVNARDRFGGI